MANDANITDPQLPEPGTDSTVVDWYGQSVQQDADLAEELVEEHGAKEAEKLFDERSDGESTQEARHGSSIDPEQGEPAYKNDA